MIIYVYYDVKKYEKRGMKNVYYVIQGRYNMGSLMSMQPVVDSMGVQNGA